ncbi:MAG: LarC family nickel insertion protein, partial [Oscillospiraceae bacterium]|nr:LarC family nickel insertion protein [Oscillospiraceae bacterium]
DADRLAAEILRHTATFGVRRTDCSRYALTASWEERETPAGTVPYKVGTGYGVTRRKPEYEALARLAREADMPLEELR